MSANNVNAQPAPTTQATATIKSRPNIMPSSYLYTSSSALLNRNSENKPTPPPTLPKYTSSFNAGSGLNRDRDKDSIGGSYRLSSLDRLAMRQKFMGSAKPPRMLIRTARFPRRTGMKLRRLRYKVNAKCSSLRQKLLHYPKTLTESIKSRRWINLQNRR
jgi:hypothetical protein